MNGGYQKLPGRGRRFDGRRWLDVTAPRSTAWLGSDHLLVVDDGGYSERYRRFPYAEIQAIVVRRTATWGRATAVLTLLAALPLVGSFLTGEVGAVWLRSLGGLLVLLLSVHALRGPTCRTTLQTAVHAEEIPSWKRLRVAHRGIARLRPLVVAAQAGPQDPSAPAA